MFLAGGIFLGASCSILQKNDIEQFNIELDDSWHFRVLNLLEILMNKIISNLELK